MKNKLTICHDCGVEPGRPHLEGCDVEHCSICGGQRMCCGCQGHNSGFARWTGIWPCKAEANYLGMDLYELATSKLDHLFTIEPLTELEGTPAATVSAKGMAAIEYAIIQIIASANSLELRGQGRRSDITTLRAAVATIREAIDAQEEDPTP